MKTIDLTEKFTAFLKENFGDRNQIDYYEITETFEEAIIGWAHHGNVKHTADFLKLNRTTLSEKLKRLRLKGFEI